MQKEVVILSGVRTAIGDFGGGLKDVPPARLGEIVIRRRSHGQASRPKTCSTL